MAFGTQTYGTQDYNSDEDIALAIASISPSPVSRVGGDEITISGNFPRGDAYFVTVDGVAAYSGVAGQGNTIKTPDGFKIAFIMPPFPIDEIGTKTVAVTSLASGSGSGSIVVVEKSFGRRIFDMRGMFPPQYGTGPRRVDAEPIEVA